MVLDKSLTLVLPSTFDSVELAVEEALSFFGHFFRDDDHLYKLHLIASEAVTNGIEHGNKYVEEKTVTVVFRVELELSVISVEDQGEGFKRKTVSDPLDESNLFSDGGRGLFLMESMADDVHYDLDGRRITLNVGNPTDA